MTKEKVSKKELQRLIGRLVEISQNVLSLPAVSCPASLKPSGTPPCRGKHDTTPKLTNDIRWFLEYAARPNELVLLKAPGKTDMDDWVRLLIEGWRGLLSQTLLLTTIP